jgi:hypothetical protein
VQGSYRASSLEFHAYPDVQSRLTSELQEKGVTEFTFRRVPSDYYGQDLEYRRKCLDAATINHLCKSIIFENTKAHPSVVFCSNPNNSKYYCVIVQVRCISLSMQEPHFNQVWSG